MHDRGLLVPITAIGLLTDQATGGGTSPPEQHSDLTPYPQPGDAWDPMAYRYLALLQVRNAVLGVDKPITISKLYPPTPPQLVPELLSAEWRPPNAGGSAARALNAAWARPDARYPDRGADHVVGSGALPVSVFADVRRYLAHGIFTPVCRVNGPRCRIAFFPSLRRPQPTLVGSARCGGDCPTCR